MSLATSALPIPDLRFESTFRRQLNARAQIESSSLPIKKERNPIQLLDPSALDAEPSSVDDTALEPIDVTITWKTVLNVVLKDVMIMPLVQGILYSSALILVKPWIQAMRHSGYEAAVWLIASFKSAVNYA